MTATTTEHEQQIDSCNKVIDHLMEALDAASHARMGYSALRSALDHANSYRARLRTELDQMLEEETRLGIDVICDGCAVRDGYEHRCHGDKSMIRGEQTNKPCECHECREVESLSIEEIRQRMGQ